jgi:hypothetical protein
VIEKEKETKKKVIDKEEEKETKKKVIDKETGSQRDRDRERE